MIDSRKPLHDYSRSRAVLMGTSEYTHLPPVPAAANSLRRIADLLGSALCGWPEDRISVWAEQPGPGDLADQLVTAFEGVLDIALFYYVGHGQIDSEDQLCLGLVGSRTEANRRAPTSLAFQAVRRALLESPAIIKIVILDCCFSGLAIRPDNTLSDANDQLTDIAGVAGAYTMAASRAYNSAWYETDPLIVKPQTYFTRYLADLTESGLPDGNAVIRLHSLFTTLRDNLERDNLPAPSYRNIDGARDFQFAYNIAESETGQDRRRRIRSDLDLRMNQINYKLTEAEARGKVLDAELEERGRQLAELFRRIDRSQPSSSSRGQLSGVEVRAEPAAKAHRAFRVRWIVKFRQRRYLALLGITACVVGVAVFFAIDLMRSSSPGAKLPQAHFILGPRVNMWTYQTAGLVDSGPTFVDGTIYVGSDGGIYALNAATGGLRWADASAGDVDSTPDVVDGSVYIGSFDPHEILALNATTGRVRWVYTTALPIDSSPFVADGTVYVGSFSGKVYALDAATGHIRWSHATGGPIESSPFVADGTVYVGSFNGTVYALDAATGHIRWSRATEGPIESSPLVTYGTVYVGSDDHKVYALNAVNGSVRWTYDTDSMVRASPVAADGCIFVGSDDDALYALNATTGRIRWMYETGGPIESSAFVAGDTVYVGSYDHKVYALDVTTGHLIWSYDTAGTVQSRPVVAAGTLYVGSFDDKVYALNAATGASKAMSSARP